MTQRSEEKAGRSGPARVVAVATAIEMSLAGLATATIFVLVLVQAGQRYLPFDGWTWTGELARYCLVWLTFVAAGVLVTRDGHISLQIVDSIPSEKVVRGLHVVADLIVCAVGIGFAWECLTLIEDSGRLKSPSMGMPMSWLYVLPLIGFASTAIRAAAAAIVVARHGVPASEEPGAATIHGVDA